MKKQTMGVRHPLLPNSEVATWLFATLHFKSPTGVHYQAPPPPRWHSGECRLFPRIMVFYWDKVERKCSWLFFPLGQGRILPLILWRCVNKMSTATASLRRKRGKWECGREPSWAKSHQGFHAVLIERRGGEEEEEEGKSKRKGR